jgi:SOS-response transcriptional repressor LexA
MNIGSLIRNARLNSGLTMKTVESLTGIPASNQSKIELGDNLAPGFSTVAKLAEVYGISLDDIYNESVSDSNRSPSTSRKRKTNHLPVLSWVQAGNWAESLEEHRDELQFIASPFRCSSNSYILEVRGESMTSQTGSRHSFPEGVLIVVDPIQEARNESFIIARICGTNEITFKQLISDMGKTYLKPINSLYPMMELNQETVVCGVVVGSINRL